MSALPGHPGALLDRANGYLTSAALIEAAMDELRALTVEGRSLALGGVRERAHATAALLESAHERYRGTAVALHEYAVALEHAHRRADAAASERVWSESQLPDAHHEVLRSRSRLDRLRHEPATPAGSIEYAQSQVHDAQWRVRQLEQAVETALGEHQGAVAEMNAAAERAIAAIDAAIAHGDTWDRVGAFFAGLWDSFVGFLAPRPGPGLALEEARALGPRSLDGRSYAARHATIRSLLDALLADDRGTRETTRTRLEAIDATLEAYPDAQIISFWLDGDEPRIALGFGDLERADSVTYIVHGINTDSKEAGPIGGIAHDLATGMAARGDRTEAVIAWLNYDSGDAWSEPGIALADRGSQTLIGDVEELRRRNPGATINGVFHSYGSTTFGQSVIAHPDAFDNAYLVGSPGLSREAARALETAMREDRLEVHASQAKSDSVAPVGYWLTWEHPVQPLALRGVSVFSSEGLDATTHRIPTGRTVVSYYDPGAGGVDGHDLDGSDERGDDFFGYLTPGSVAYQYVLESIAGDD